MAAVLLLTFVRYAHTCLRIWTTFQDREYRVKHGSIPSSRFEDRPRRNIPTRQRGRPLLCDGAGAWAFGHEGVQPPERPPDPVRCRAHRRAAAGDGTPLSADARKA